MRLQLVQAGLALALLPVFAPASVNAQEPSAPSIQQLMADGLRAIHQNDLARAQQSFRAALAANPNIPEAYLGLGMAALRGGHLEDAEDSLRRALQLDDNLREAHMFLGIAQYQANEVPAAIDSLQKELSLQPGNVEALTWLGIVELAAGHPELATGPLDHAAALSPKNAEILDYRGRAHTQVAQQSFQQLYEMDPGSWHVHRALGEILSEAHQPEQAITEFKAAIEEQPNNADLYEALGNEYQRASKTQEAMNAYQSELKLNPRSPIALFALGKLYVESDRPSDGIPLLRQAVDAHVPPGPAYYYIGLALSNSADYTAAVEALETCLSSKPATQVETNAWYALSRAYSRLNRPTDAQHALDEFKRLKAAQSQSPSGSPTKN